MTTDVRTVTEDNPLEEIVTLMEKYRIKRVPVMSGEQLVGIVSRANLLHLLAGLAREAAPGPRSDEVIRDRVRAELDRQSWAPRHLVDVAVRNGIVELWGTVLAAGQRDAARVLAENVPGVKEVRSHLVWIEPMSGMVLSDPDERPAATGAAPSNAVPPAARVS